MATLADELANDFRDDSGDENGAEDLDLDANGFMLSMPKGQSAAVDEDMEDLEAEGEDMEDPDALHDEAAEETEHRLGRERKEQAPKDIRSVSSFMKSLEPILEVSTIIYYGPILNSNLHL